MTQWKTFEINIKESWLFVSHMREGRDEEIQNLKAVLRNLHQDDTIIGDENVHLTKTIVSIVMQHKS